jgi:flagellar basal body-associated protein FliL
MHIRREIDNLLDDMIEIITQKKSSSSEERKTEENLLKEIKDKIKIKTNNGKYAKGMWTDSPEFLYNR